jgi:hypothetical protein
VDNIKYAYHNFNDQFKAGVGLASAEIAAMGAIEDALEPLDSDARTRVLKWAVDRYKADFSVPAIVPVPGAPMATTEPHRGVLVGELEQDRSSESLVDRFEHFGPFYGECNPTDLADQMLVAGYWSQMKVGIKELTTRDLNKLLQTQGVANRNMNKQVDKLRGPKQSPKLISLIKGGSADNTHKAFQLTDPGLRHVEGLAAANGA